MSTLPRLFFSAHEYKYFFLNRTIWPGTTSDQSGPGGNGNEGVPANSQISKTGALSPDAV